MDPASVPIFSAVLAAVGGGVIGAAVNQVIARLRALAVREEATRTIQRDAAGALLAATRDYARELGHARLGQEGGPPGGAAEKESRERREDVHRRFRVELHRARMAVVEPEARKVVSDLHQTYEAVYGGAPVDGRALTSHPDRVHQLERALHDHSARLLDVGVRNLRPGGPGRQA